MSEPRDKDRGAKTSGREHDYTGSSSGHIMKIVHKYPLMSREEEVEVLRRAEHGDAAAQHALVLHNLRMVVAVSKEFRGKGLPFEDLFNEGAMGLEEASKRVKSAKGTKFVTYATWWIRKCMRNALHLQQDIVRIPIHQRQRSSMVFRLASEIRQASFGRKATYEELGRKLGLTREKVRIVYEETPADYMINRLEDQIRPDDDRTIGDSLAEQERSPLDSVIRAEAHDQLRMFLGEELTWIEQKIVMLRFGLGDATSRSLKEIGEQVHLSRERVRQIEAVALGKLRRRLEAFEAQERAKKEKLKKEEEAQRRIAQADEVDRIFAEKAAQRRAAYERKQQLEEGSRQTATEGPSRDIDFGPADYIP